jgi:hypothetical protein
LNSAQVSEVAARALSFLPMISGVRPRRSRAAVDQHRNELGGVVLAALDLGQVDRLGAERLGGQSFGVEHPTHRGDGVDPVMRSDQERLRLVVADHPDPQRPPHLGQVVLELGPELGVGEVVDRPRVVGSVVHHHPSSHRAQM